MNPFEEYIIPYKGLKDGIHQFDFQINDSFFSLFPEGEIQRGQLQAGVEMEKGPHFLIFRINLEGQVMLPCDRCLEFMEVSVDYEDELVIRFGEVIEDLQIAGEEKPVLSEEDHEFNLAHTLYEMVHLSLPLRRVHGENSGSDSGCNPEMLEQIGRHSADPEQAEKTDPRWDKLKSLFN